MKKIIRDYHNKEKIIKASFKNCLVSDRKLFSRSNCIMPISVGQKVHENEKLLATVRLINSHFNECTILVDDSIQRHTMEIESSLDKQTLYELSVAEGDAWISRNAHIYEQFTISYKVIRWDSWLSSDAYRQSYEAVNYYYNKNDFYKREIERNIEEFLSRYQNHVNTKCFDYQKAFSCCLDYLREECATMCLWAEGGYHFEVYPTGRNRAMTATHELLIKPKYPTLLKSVSLRFKKH